MIGNFDKHGLDIEEEKSYLKDYIGLAAVRRF